MPRFLPVSLLLLSAVMWGLSWWPLKFFHGRGLDDLSLLLIAYGGVGLALLPWLISQYPVWRSETRFVLLILLLGGYGNLAFAQAMIHGDVVRAMMLFYLAPVWGVLAGRLFLGEAIDARRWAGVLLAVTGAFLVLGGVQVFSGVPSAVDLLALTAGMAFALSNVTTRAAQGVPLGTKAAAVFLGCGLMALLLMLLLDRPVPSLPAVTWGWLSVFALGGLLLATVTGQWAVTRLQAGRASVILITELLVAALSATVIGNEVLSKAELIGGLLILIAALLEAGRPEGVTPTPGAPSSPI